MKLSSELENAINVQMKNEFFSAALYRNMAAWAATRGYSGMAHWFRCQAAEETEHGDKFLTFLLDCNNFAYQLGVESPATEWNSCLAVFQYTLAHEKFVSTSIHSIMFMAREERHLQAEPILLEFIAEQVEEEEQAQTIVDRLGLAGDNAAAILQIDKELGER